MRTWRVLWQFFNVGLKYYLLIDNSGVSGLRSGGLLLGQSILPLLKYVGAQAQSKPILWWITVQCVPVYLCLCVFVNKDECQYAWVLKCNPSPKQNACTYWTSMKLMCVWSQQRPGGGGALRRPASRWARPMQGYSSWQSLCLDTVGRQWSQWVSLGPSYSLCTRGWIV